MSVDPSDKGWSHSEMAARAAAELSPGEHVTLGIGLPSLLPKYLPEGVRVTLHSDNGIAETGANPYGNVTDADRKDEDKATATVNPDTSFFVPTLSFGMIRGRHIDTAVLDGMQVSASGDLAHSMATAHRTRNARAVDFAHGARNVIVLMEHTDRCGSPKIVEHCTLPLTGEGIVHRIITNLAVIDVMGGGVLNLKELARGITIGDVLAATDAPLELI